MAPIEPDFYNSNVTPYTLFGAYLVLASGLTFFALRTLNEAYKSLPPSAAVRHRRSARIHHVEFYACLALISLLSAIYFNSHIISLSHRVWAYERDPGPLRPLAENVFGLKDVHGLQWGRWLRETDVLEEFYEIVVEKSRRRWWIQQLFMAATPWSVFVVVEGQRRHIPHLWSFIGLAPLVSLSFAQSLFYLAVLWTPVPLNKRRKLREAVNPKHPIFFAATIVTFLAVAVLPFTTGTASLGISLSILLLSYLSPLSVPAITAYFGQSAPKVKTQAKSQAAYGHGYGLHRLVAALALITHLAYLAVAVLDQTDHRAFWNRHSSILHHEAEPPSWRQAQGRIAKILNSATDHPSVARAAVDTILAAIGLFAWTYFRGLRVKGLLSCIGLWGELPQRTLENVTKESSRAVTPLKEKIRKASDSLSRSGRRRIPSRKAELVESDDDDENDASFRPSSSSRVDEGDDDREESNESAALAWGLSVIGGLGYVTAATLGAETSA